MEFRRIWALRGPNIWASFPVLELELDLGDLKDKSSDEMPGFNERLMGWLPSMIEHRCSVGERGGFFQRLRRGTYLAHILEHVTLELQSLAGTEVGYGRARETDVDGVYKVAIEYDEEELGRACLETGRRLCLAAVYDEPFDVAAEVARLKELAYDVRLGPSTSAIVEAAKARGIPFRRLNTGSLVQLGHGKHGRRILTAETDRTSAIAESVAQDKQLTRTLLKSIGVPVPEGRPVSSAEDAWETAQDIGLPVVVKPQYGNHGRGVATNLSTREQVLKAYAAASEESSSIIVETFAPGDDHRILVIGNRVIAAARREPAHVIGDGQSTIRGLVDEVNRDPRRSDGHSTVLSFIKLDAIGLEVLAEQGFTPDSVPEAGRRVLIRRNGNLSTGGTATDVTDLLHPEVAARAVEAARMVGLDIAGVDVVCVDVSRPLEEQRGAIVEVNAGPGLRMHLEPSSGQPRPVGEAIVNMLFPAGENGRIPIAAVTGVNGKTTTTRLIAHVLRRTGKTVGMTTTDGICIGTRQIETRDCAGPQSARAVLLNPEVEVAVFETARGGILREGLGFDRCDVAVVTNIGQGDHLGLRGIETLEMLAKVKRTVVEAVPKGGTAVLNADDPHVISMAEYCRGKVLWFSTNPQNEHLAEVATRGERTATVRDGSLILAEGATEHALLRLDEIPATHGGRVKFQVENALASAAALWALNIPETVIVEGLRSFASDAQQAPGRFNVVKSGAATVIVDYFHNASALMAVVEALDAFPHLRRTLVFGAFDRRDEEIVEIGRLLGNSFDRIILFGDTGHRDRQDGELTAILRRGLDETNRAAEIIDYPSEQAAIEAALASQQSEELLLIGTEEIEPALALVRRVRGNSKSLEAAAG